jgi:hypothetical protein
VRALNLRNPLRCSNGHNLAAFIAGFGSEIDNPVGAFNHFEIVLDHNQRMPGVDQSLEQLQQNRDIIEMQSGGWFVENKKIAAWRDELPLVRGRAEARPSGFSEVANEF